MNLSTLNKIISINDTNNINVIYDICGVMGMLFVK